jgi:hypothetical protein
LSVSRFALLTAATLWTLCGAPREMALVMQEGGVFPGGVRREMERETARIALQAGIQVQFVDFREAAGRQFGDLVVFRMRGDCVVPARATESGGGALASAAFADGKVLPFGEVFCAKVGEALRRTMGGSDFARAELLLGRALGRVVAHELYHMAANTRHHGKDGIAKEALSARQLMSERLEFAEEDSARMATVSPAHIGAEYEPSSTR